MEFGSEKDNVVEITDGIFFNDVYGKPYVPVELIDEIKSASVLLLPYENFRGRPDYLFPEETEEFYRFISNETKDKGVKTDICISDELYKKLELHADTIAIPALIVSGLVFPVIVETIKHYLFNKKKIYARDDLRFKVDMTVVKGKKSKKIKYEGNIENFERVMKSFDENGFK